MTQRDIAIVGGSIAGLTAACLLARRGHTVRVFERSAGALTGRGAGIVTHPGLRAVLARCCGPAGAADLGVTVEGRRVLDRDGRVVAERTLPQILAGWGRLYRLLLDALPPGSVRYDAALERVVPQEDRVVAEFADGSRVTADLLVGADGQFSTVRAQFLQDVTPTYAGYVAWRAVVEEAALSRETREAICGHFAFCLPPGEQILGYPVSGGERGGERGGETGRRYNAVWYRPTPETALHALLTDSGGVRHALSIPPGRIKAEVLAGMRADAERILAPAFAEVMRRADQPFLQAILDIETPTMRPARGVALIGDAAFVARPHVGMGVTKAMEDAAALADALDAHPGDGEAALAAFDRTRHAAGAAIVARGRDLGAYLQAQQHGEAERRAAERFRSPGRSWPGPRSPRTRPPARGRFAGPDRRGSQGAGRTACARTASGRASGGLALSRNSTVVKIRSVSPILARSWVIDSPAPKDRCWMAPAS